MPIGDDNNPGPWPMQAPTGAKVERMERDPRVNPKAGDLLTKNGLSRRVVEVASLDVYWRREGSDRRVQPAWISTWREWAKNSDVVEVAP
jgi:hypothetical protein